MWCEIVFKFNFSFDGNQVTSAPSAHYHHRITSLGRLQNIPIVVGDSATSAVGKKSRVKAKVEGLLAGTWTSHPDFPIEPPVSAYSMVNWKGALFLFGMLISLTN